MISSQKVTEFQKKNIHQLRGEKNIIAAVLFATIEGIKEIQNLTNFYALYSMFQKLHIVYP